MIPQYKRIATVATGLLVADFALIVVLGRGSGTASVWGPGGAPMWLAYVASLLVFVAFWAYAKAKGRSGGWGIVLPFLSVIGLVILLLLKDESGRPSGVKCPKCQGANEAIAQACRYCHEPLAAP